MTCSFKIRPIDIQTLCIILASMRPSKSTGTDGVSISMIQKFFYGIGFPLLDTINSSIITGSVPKGWKHALVTPIPKGKVTAEPSDTRPISILPAITKLIERVVQEQLTHYLEEHKLLSDAQHGYRKHHSTESALHVITDAALQAMQKGEISILVLLDLSKCFDVVPHSKLLNKLNLYGIETDWFRSYLEGHTQQVQMRGMKSNTRDNNIGVYQGGSLSCLLYMLYANDLSLCVGSDVTVVQYADDTQILVSGKKRDLQTVITRMQTALNSMYQWFCQNGMKLNAQKTKMLVLGTPAMLRNMPPVTVNFCGATIPDSRVVQNLGLHMDRHLNYQSHIDALSRKCTGVLLALSHARHVIPRAAFKAIVEALVLSIVRYCLSIYGSSGNVQIHRVQKIVNFAARVVTGRRRYDHVSDAIVQLGWMTADQLVHYHTLTAVNRTLMTGLPAYMRETIGPRANAVHSHGTRNANRWTLPQIRCEAGRRRLCYRGVSMLNEIDIEPCTTYFRHDLKVAILHRGTE